MPQASAYCIARKVDNLGAFARKLALALAIAFCAQRQLGARCARRGLVSGFRHFASIQSGGQFTIVAF
jgi:hypothetical protein